MGFLKKKKDEFAGFLFDSSLNMKDRTFVLFTVCELLALFVVAVADVAIGASWANVLISIIAIAVGAIPIYICVKKKKLGIARVVLSLTLVFVLRPLAYFVTGGIYNGALVMFLMGAIYLVFILDGKFRIVVCLTDLAIYLTCVIISYLHPEFVAGCSRRDNYFNSVVQYIVGLVLMTVIMTFWTKVLQKEATLAAEQTKELEELNKSQSRFFSSMSHEIRTPINTVLGMNEIILRQEDASEEIIKDARNIQGAGKLLLALINDILDISKIEAGKMDIVPVNYDVSALLSEVVNMIWMKTEEKGLKFMVDIDPNVPQGLFGDEVRIKQILINLLNNAVKYTKEGSVSLHLECEFPGETEVLLKINVSDTGMGIKPEALPHLFDTFQRQDEEKNCHIEGTGLGLSIVKQLVELMNGEITVNSVYGEGTEFAVTVRQGISSEKRVGDINIMNSGYSGKADKFEHSFRAPNARILIVDDNEMNLLVEEKLLNGTDVTVDIALSGAEALSKTLQERYDVIFMDHLMPEMDGIECFSRIRSQKGGLNRNVPIIVLTANAGGENIELYNNTGFDAYLVKPVSGRQLEDMLLVHLPAEKLIRTADNEMTGSAMSTSAGYSRKKPIVIGTSSMTDLPNELTKELGINIIPFTVTTEEGTFWDNIDFDSDELIRYMGDGERMVTSESATEEEYVRYFSSLLKKAHQVIYITLASTTSVETGRVKNAAKSFENVTIVNSECLSSATGILVLVAARLVQQNLPVEKIVEELEIAKKLINCSFVIKSTNIMARRGQISQFASNVLSTLWLRPVLRMKNDKLGVGTFLFGDIKRCYAKYIKKAFPAKVNVDTSFVFLTYAGLEEEELLWIEKKLSERIQFDHIIFQKASAGIASNCGQGTFGLLYMKKGDRSYNIGSLFDKDNIYDDDVELEDDEDEAGEAVLSDLQEVTGSVEDSGELIAISDDEETAGEKQWYDNISGIDSAAAIKNSGTEDAFLSVIKIYYDTYDAKSGEIQKFYESEDWENYTIKVHALKSSSRLVGALQIGDEAEALEMAGKSGDVDFIRAHHDELMEKYHGLHIELDPVFGEKEDLPEIDPDMLKDGYNELLEFAVNKDYELSMMIMDSVKEFSLPPEDKDRFTRIQEKLSQMDWDGLIEIIHEVV